MRARAGARAVLRLKPATSRKPLVAGSRPQSMRNVVVFPAPLGPTEDFASANAERGTGNRCKAC